MSKNWGRTPVTNADKRQATQTKYLVETADGTEERIDRRPLGKVERFVDNDGNVTSLQMYADGDSQRAATEIRNRAAYHRKGFVEFSKCPLKHGTRHASTQTSKDFSKMPARYTVGKGDEKQTIEVPPMECKHDPRVMERKDGDLYAKNACPHIEWLIWFRRQEAAKAYAKRNAHIAALERQIEEKKKLEALQTELLQEQIAERKARKSPKAKEATTE